MPSPDSTSSSVPLSVIDELRALEVRVVNRINELAPLESELQELRSTAQRLGLDLDAASETKATTPAGTTGEPKRRRARRAKSSGQTSKRRAGQSRPRGSRAEDVIKAVGEHPGISVSGVGDILKVDSTGLYRVIKKLEGDGRLRKEGSKLHPVAAEG